MKFLEILKEDSKQLVARGAEQIEIGQTLLGRSIYAYEIGCGRPVILAQYAIHAREHITYFLANLHAIDLLKSLGHGNGTVYIIPVVNIDGVALCLDGVDTAGYAKENLIKLNGESIDFSLWKANARGVDLNVNFHARWGTGKHNVLHAGSQNYIGSIPNSEPETRALIDFTKRIMPDVTLSFHCKGEVIYYDFHQELCAKRRDKRVAKVVSKSTGYKIIPSGKSAGGYKDWCIENLKIPSLTIEVGNDGLLHPIGREHLPKIWQKTHRIYDDLFKYLRHKKRIDIK